GQAVIHHAPPGAQLAEFLPPFDFDGVVGRRTRAEKQQYQDNDQADSSSGAASAAAGIDCVPGHAPKDTIRMASRSEPRAPVRSRAHRRAASSSARVSAALSRRGDSGAERMLCRAANFAIVLIE